MKRNIRGFLLSLLAPAILTAAASAASFPVPSTDESGVTRWGYMADGGRKVTDFIYASAEEFGENGLAVVTNSSGRIALVREDGKQVTGWLPNPDRVEGNEQWLMLDYGDHIAYYDTDGGLAATIEGAKGFPGDGLVAASNQEGRNSLYGYRLLHKEKAADPVPAEDEEAPKADGKTAAGEASDEAGKAPADGEEAQEAETPEVPEEENPFAIPAQYQAVGTFRKGRAVVQTVRGDYVVIDTRGAVLKELPTGTVPAALDIYDGDVVILEMQGKYALYSLETMQFASSFSYDEILPFDQAAARCRVGNLWGLIGADGALIVEPMYPYLSYMGEGVYAARGTDPGAAAVSETGRVLYSTGTYVGGFQTFIHGYSWHGKLDGSVVFFNSIGTIACPVENATDPQVLTGKVVRVTVDGVDTYIDIRSGETLYTNVRKYTLENGLTIASETYEKYLGMTPDGEEIGYQIEYPQVSGHADEAVQGRINDALRSFFVTGPSGSQERSLAVTYGFSVEGQVLVVWANGVSGAEDSAVIWNDSIGVDMVTGERYTVYDSLFGSGATTVLLKRLPQKDAPYYTYPRMDADGVTFYRNYPSKDGRAAYSKSLRLTFEQLAGALDTSGACYQALTAAGNTALAAAR